MKASLKFRENENPIVKAKIPLNRLGFPFQCGIETSTSDPQGKDLCLSFSTFFQSGPVLKLFYRPNRAMGLMVKTGVGYFGSPIESPNSISAEFNGNPRFFLHFKPGFGDLSIRRWINLKKSSNDNNKVTMHARRVFPIMDKVVVGKIGWNLKFPPTESGFPLPYMVVNKLGIQYGSKDRNSLWIRGHVCLALKRFRRIINRLKSRKARASAETTM